MASRFPGTALHLTRYAQGMNCAEINSSFYRSHRASTYERWAASTPDAFRFSVKVPKAITHECGLAPARDRIARFLDELTPLGEKLGPLLMQLPPKQVFAEAQAREFLSRIRDAAPEVQMVLEPRHPGWCGEDAGGLLRAFGVARVMADPLPKGVPGGEEEAGGLAYYRLHGSPRVYYSSYDAESLGGLAERMRVRLARGQEVWCVFDNTASGAALGDALRLRDQLSR